MCGAVPLIPDPPDRFSIVGSYNHSLITRSAAGTELFNRIPYHLFNLITCSVISVARRYQRLSEEISGFDEELDRLLVAEKLRRS
jgi:hypothetical protein